MPQHPLTFSRRTALAAPVGIAAAAACVTPEAWAQAAAQPPLPGRLFTLTSRPMTMAREATRVAIASSQPSAFLQVLDLASHRTVLRRLSSYGTQGRCTSVALHRGWLVWVDQSRIQSDDNLSAPWRLYALAPGARVPVCLRASTPTTAFLPPTLSEGPDGLWWTEWEGPRTRTVTVLTARLEAARPAVTVWRKGSHLAEIAPLGQEIVATNTVLHPTSYQCFIEAVTTTTGRTTRFTTSGNSYSPKASRQALAWVERRFDGPAMVRGALMTATPSGPRLGVVRNLAATEQLLGMCGHHVLVGLAGRLLAIDLSGGRTLVLGTAFAGGTVPVNGRTVTWLEDSGSGYVCRERVL